VGNLLLPPKIREGGLSTPPVFELFPNLKERLHSREPGSPAESSRCWHRRILRTGAPAPALDEPTEGLAPVIVQQMAIDPEAEERMASILAVEQNLRFAGRGDGIT